MSSGLWSSVRVYLNILWVKLIHESRSQPILNGCHDSQLCLHVCEQPGIGRQLAVYLWLNSSIESGQGHRKPDWVSDTLNN